MEIEKNVPLPKNGSKSKYPWPDMEVGDSVFFAVGDFAGCTKEQVSAHGYGNNYGKKFKARKVKGGQRIWRVS